MTQNPLTLEQRLDLAEAKIAFFAYTFAKLSGDHPELFKWLYAEPELPEPEPGVISDPLSNDGQRLSGRARNVVSIIDQHSK